MSEIGSDRLKNIQGNILRGFNKDHSRLIFFRIEDVDKTRELLFELVDARKIPSTQDLLDAAAQMKERWNKEPNFKPRETWIHAAFSSKGIVKFGLELPPSVGAYVYTDGTKPDGTTPERVISLQNGSAADPNDPYKVGMHVRATDLGDTGNDGPDTWLKPFRPGSGGEFPPIDGLLRVDSDEPEDADKATVDLIVESTQRGIIVEGLQKGTGIFNVHGKQIEHFGFRDGVSQPLIRDLDDEEIQNRQVNKDDHSWKKFVLFDLTGNRQWANDGSFMVFRRLNQDFAGFWQFMNLKSQEFGLTPASFAS